MKDHASEKCAQQPWIGGQAVPEACFDAVGRNEVNFADGAYKGIQCSQHELSTEAEARQLKAFDPVLFQKQSHGFFPFVLLQRYFSVSPVAVAVEIKIKHIKSIVSR